MNKLLNLFYDIEKLVSKSNSDFQFSGPASVSEINFLKSSIEASLGVLVSNNLVAYFEWHNGQNTPTRMIKESNRVFINIREAVENWLFLIKFSDHGMPNYNNFWFPIMKNNSGDFLLFNLLDESLVSFWHDNARRDVEHESIYDWLLFLNNELIKEQSSSEFLKKTKSTNLKNFSVLIYSKVAIQNTKLLMLVRKHTGLPISQVSKNLKNTFPRPVLEFDLSLEINTIEVIRRVKKIQLILKSFGEYGIDFSVFLREVGREPVEVTIEELEELKYRWN